MLICFVSARFLLVYKLAEKQTLTQGAKGAFAPPSAFLCVFSPKGVTLGLSENEAIYLN